MTLGAAATVPSLLITHLEQAGWNIPYNTIDKVLSFYLANAGKTINIYSFKDPTPAQEIARNTNTDIIEVSRIMNTIETLVQDGLLSPRYLIPETQTTTERAAETIRETMTSTATTAATKTENILRELKWVGFVALGGVALWFAWPYLKRLRG